MQKSLITQRFVASFWQRIFTSRAGLPAGLMLLLLTGLANSAMAANGFYKNYVTIRSGGGNGAAPSTQKFYTISNGEQFAQPFQSLTGPFRNLGSFDRNGTLQISSTEANTVNDEGYDMRSTQLLYRVYRDGTPAAELAGLPFAPLALDYRYSGGDNLPNSKNWYNNDTNPNLLAATSGAGTYVLELYFQGVVANSENPDLNTEILDDNGGNRYKAVFVVNDNSDAQAALWKGKSTDWFLGSNWSTGQVPNQFTDVTIPYGTTNSAATIPTITSTDGRVARVRTLRILGNGQRKGAQLKLSTGELQVYGDFQDAHAGFSQSSTSIFTLAGVMQTFDGALFSTIRIQGDGTKTLTNAMSVSNRLEFLNGGGVLVTRSDNAVTYNVIMEIGSLLAGENNDSYVQGVVRATKRIINQGGTDRFSNIGVDLKAETGIPGGVIVTRRTDFFYEGVGTSRGIARSFDFSPENTEELNFSLVFHYRDAELGLINERNLLLFSTEDGGIPFTNLKVTSADPGGNTLTRNYIQKKLGGSFTLGSSLNPLPVTIKSFTAAVQGADAVLTWVTAQEINSKGFEVQVSSDGQNFRTLGFAASATPNSTAPRSYQYRDAEDGKQGTRYYRLRQLDLDGKEQFIGPKSLSFGASTAVSAKASPNPFTAEINLSLQTVAAGPATVSVLDGLGRRVRTWQPTLTAGASSLPLTGLQALPHGLYVVEVRYQDGQTQRLKLVKE